MSVEIGHKWFGCNCVWVSHQKVLYKVSFCTLTKRGYMHQLKRIGEGQRYSVLLKKGLVGIEVGARLKSTLQKWAISGPVNIQSSCYILNFRECLLVEEIDRNINNLIYPWNYWKSTVKLRQMLFQSLSGVCFVPVVARSTKTSIVSLSLKIMFFFCQTFFSVVIWFTSVCNCM